MKVNKALFTHSLSRVIHSFPTGKNSSEQDFLSLSTDIGGGYYYYLYIQETRPQANPTGFFFETQLTKKQLAVKDFQLKKKRVKA
jgi:hypothetical protein